MAPNQPLHPTTLNANHNMALVQDQPYKMQLESTAVSSQEKNVPSRFLDLPAELRNRIYRYAMVSNRAIEVRTKPIGAGHCRLAMVPALTKVSKQLRSETQCLFFQENRFKIKLEVMQTQGLKALLALRLMHQNVDLNLRSLQVSYKVKKRCAGYLYLLRADLTLSETRGGVEITEQAYTGRYIGRKSLRFNSLRAPHANVCGCAVKGLVQKHNASAESNDLVLFLEKLKKQSCARRSYNTRDIYLSNGQIYSADLCPKCSGTTFGSRCFLF